MLDVSLFNTQSRLCNGISRRNFVRVGAITPLGLSLPRLMAADADAKHARAKSVILIFLGGGLSHHDSFDMKPEAVEQIRGKYQSIATTVPGLNICELLPKTAQIMNTLTLVRSGTHENDHHETATNWVLSGRFGTPFGDHPAIGSIVAHETGFSGVVPPYVAVPKNPSFTWELGKSVWLGGRYESFKAGNANDANYRVRDLSAPAGLTPQSLERRKSLLAAVDQLATRVKGSDEIATYDEFSRKAAEMVLSPQAQAAFAIEREDPKTRDEYGRSEFGQSALLARRLVENNVRFVTINYGGWDHHGEIFKGLDKKLPEFDQGYSALILDLDQRGLLDDTLVLTMGEFGRTPKVNDKAGRDHWGRAGSMLWAGAGVARGRVIGATDKNGAFVTDRPVRPADVAWTIYNALGIDPSKELLTPEGRPVSILAEGAAVTELFS
ncbi:MAG: DUF1501 domain-containing protein [Planctomycetaceae bacterium]|jgi:Protein of unknown function (DUF1501)|nr:MAG: DUF1501 domain-containing protein [Planctomycetaceae bacterium]